MNQAYIMQDWGSQLPFVIEKKRRKEEFITEFKGGGSGVPVYLELSKDQNSVV